MDTIEVINKKEELEALMTREIRNFELATRCEVDMIRLKYTDRVRTGEEFKLIKEAAIEVDIKA